MAILRLGPFAQAVSGSIGGVTFAASGSRTIARRKPQQRKHTSQRALQAKANLNAQLATWTRQTDLIKRSWNRVAGSITWTDRLGTPRRLSGQQLWTKLRSFDTQFTSKQTFAFPQRSLPAAELTLSASIISIAFTATLSYHGTNSANVLLYGRRTFSTTLKRPTRAWVFLQSITAQPATVFLEEPWLKSFGTLIVDEVIEIKAVLLEPNRFPSPPTFAHDTTT
jgi:hypothetical protein